MDQGTAERLRRESRARAAARAPGPEVAAVDDLDAGGVRVRRYAAQPGEPAVVAVYAHGGYFVVGDLDSQDAYCRRLTAAIGGVVYSVDYALAPEARAEESIAGFLAAARLAHSEHPDGALVLSGDSAGGAIAFVAAARLRDEGMPVAALFLTNPSLDLSLAVADRTVDGGPDLDLLADAVAAWAGSDAAAPGVDPARTPVDGLPPTIIAVGTRDALRPEAVHMHERLSAAGVPGRLILLEGVGHGFVGGGTVGDAEARDQALAALGELLAR